MGFVSLEIGKRALIAQQTALDVIGHNIANVNTPGFSRQEAMLAQTPPYMAAGGLGAIGTGVTVTDIRRIRDAFIDAQVRAELKALGKYETMSTAMEEIETIFNEPSDSGIRSVLDLFWTSLQDLSNNPESQAVRSTVRERAVSVAEAIKHTYRQLDQMQKNVDTSIRTKVSQVNTFARQIAELNVEITRAKASGQRPNDLMDQRDLILDNLAKVLDIRVTEDPAGWCRVTVGGVALVESDRAFELDVQNTPQGFARVIWPSTGLDISITSGELEGYRRMRDVVIPELKTDMNELAASIIDEVNTQHSLGFDYNGDPGGTFFKGTDAVTIDVGDAVAGNVALIAASSSSLVGDGSNALTIAQLRHKLTMKTDPAGPVNATWDDFVRGVVGRIGVDAEEVNRMQENTSLLVQGIENRRQSVCGVSLDEEMTNMIKFQHAYEAAARVITTADEMLDVLVNRTGLVGR
ncbi:MAG: flagellar hook-associated protein FlgK [Firmicutes bacterium]|nr:flagellar hook-associated protein FlgK [Bacillota bacterium]